MDDYGDYADYGYDYGGYDYSSPDYSTTDPASAYYTPQSSWTQDNYVSPMDLAPGSGMWQNEDTGAGGTIYAPGGGSQGGYGMTAGQYDAMRGAAPDPRTSGYSATGEDSWSSPGYTTTGQGFIPQGYSGPQGYSSPQRQQPSGGQRSMAQQAPQQIYMGRPEDDLYKRYKSLLMNPDFTGDPTYQFLYNQGLQSLNRNLAAKRMSLSGKSMNDTMAYGAGMASKYMQDLIPQYRGGAQEELQRFLGPAGLLPRYAATNNAAIGQADNMTARADMNSYLRNSMPLDMSGFNAPQGSGIGYGGLNYTGPRLSVPPITTPVPRPLSYGDDISDSYYDDYDLEGLFPDG